MSDTSDKRDRDSISQHLYDVNSSDPDSKLVDRSHLTPEHIAQIGQIMQSLSRLREAERAVASASEKYMKLSSQDMRALHYLIVANNRQELVTPGMLATHLDISAASTTKLLNRLERGDHIIRNVHPLDRRAFAIEVTPDTKASATDTVGRLHSRRFHAAARLSPEERNVVITFLEDMIREISLDNANWAKEPEDGN
ncbi:MarR family protein [Corynebacterium occultum]|uniref:MarR family protein n=1 Tax=Corynebacterium occultum TaxID=2675219 RepID=A0A6B8W1K7_9CORY|nr:MarR family transcriptional regulator [Corynebacterium occultum]QGU07404.1 MarR family protein [Corynebacterium occultum]